jgi:xanthosine utilization system XapX-like protein
MRIVLLTLGAVLLTVAWVGLVWTSVQLNATPNTVASVVLGVAATLVGQAIARRR